MIKRLAWPSGVLTSIVAAQAPPGAAFARSAASVPASGPEGTALAAIKSARRNLRRPGPVPINAGAYRIRDGSLIVSPATMNWPRPR